MFVGGYRGDKIDFCCLLGPNWTTKGTANVVACGVGTWQKLYTRRRQIWNPSRSEKENLFLWQIIYLVPATNTWRHPSIPCNAPETWCDHCDLSSYKDIQHCIWWCPRSLTIWDWATSLIQHAITHQHRRITIDMQLTPLAAPLAAHKDTPKIWWELIFGACCWIIWKSNIHSPWRGLIRQSRQ